MPLNIFFTYSVTVALFTGSSVNRCETCKKLETWRFSTQNINYFFVKNFMNLGLHCMIHVLLLIQIMRNSEPHCLIGERNWLHLIHFWRQSDKVSYIMEIKLVLQLHYWFGYTCTLYYLEEKWLNISDWSIIHRVQFLLNGYFRSKLFMIVHSFCYD